VQLLVGEGIEEIKDFAIHIRDRTEAGEEIDIDDDQLSTLGATDDIKTVHVQAQRHAQAFRYVQAIVLREIGLCLVGLLVCNITHTLAVEENRLGIVFQAEVLGRGLLVAVNVCSNHGHLVNSGTVVEIFLYEGRVLDVFLHLV